MKMSIYQSDKDWAENALNEFPEITSYGYGLPLGCSDGWGISMSDRNIGKLIAARDFLSGFKPLQRVSYGSSASYSSPTATELKSLLQRYRGVYVYEGDIILAALALGIPTRNYSGSHAQIGVSRKQYRALRGVVECSSKHLTP